VKILVGKYPVSYLQRRYCSPSFRHVLLLRGAVYYRRCRHFQNPRSFLFSFSSFRTSFRLLPRAQRLLTKLPLQRRSCRAIHVKPFKLEFIYATALRNARANSAALFVPLWTHNSLSSSALPAYFINFTRSNSS